MATKEKDYFSALYKVAKVINSSLEPARVLEEITQSVAKALKAKACALRLLAPNKKELIMGASFGLTKGYLRKGKVLVEKSGLDKRALAGKTIHMLDARTDPDFQYGARAKKEGIASVLVTPLKVGRRKIGVLRVYTNEPREFDKQEVKFLQAAANLSAIALDNARLHKALQTDYDLLVAHKDRLDDN